MNPLLRMLTVSPFGMKVRALLRRSTWGRRLLSRVAGSFNRSYEQRFHEAIVHSLRPGDVVWDIGANVGLYTRIFLDAVGETGRVVAVEPTPASAQRCRELVGASDHRLQVVEAALSDHGGTARLQVDSDVAVTNRLAGDAEASGQTVRLMTGQQLSAETDTRPSLIKIDVEGYEVHVLRGMGTVLAQRQLRELFIEVHSQLLVAGGIHDGPQQLEALLKPHGFTLEWVDFSHVVARR
jgi:FkbM family methyltransferase